MSAVLIVDDTPDCLEPMAKLLRLSGHAVECAVNGRDALDVLGRFRPDVILLDLMMPVMDGVEFLAEMRKDPQWKDVRVIVLTGYGEGLQAKRLVELGVGEVLLKASFDFKRLLQMVA